MVDPFVVCVCGGRGYRDSRRVFQVLDDLHSERPISKVVTGAAPGADNLAERWALSRCVDYAGCPANWKKHGKSAGPIRNSHMLDEYEPDLVVAFPGGNGTADMVQKTLIRSVNIKEIV